MAARRTVIGAAVVVISAAVSAQKALKVRTDSEDEDSTEYTYLGFCDPVYESQNGGCARSVEPFVDLHIQRGGQVAGALNSTSVITLWLLQCAMPAILVAIEHRAPLGLPANTTYKNTHRWSRQEQGCGPGVQMEKGAGWRGSGVAGWRGGGVPHPPCRSNCDGAWVPKV